MKGDGVTAKAEASGEELLGVIARGELRLLKMRGGTSGARRGSTSWIRFVAA